MFSAKSVETASTEREEGKLRHLRDRRRRCPTFPFFAFDKIALKVNVVVNGDEQPLEFLGELEERKGDAGFFQMRQKT